MPLLFLTIFFFNDTATTEIYTLSLHDALPILRQERVLDLRRHVQQEDGGIVRRRSEEHTSELQSRPHLVCRLLLEKKKKNIEQSWSTMQTRTSVVLRHRPSSASGPCRCTGSSS